MYEPVVLKKKQPRTLSGTPAAKTFVIVTLIKIFIPTALFYVLSEFRINNKKLIAELEEGYRNRKKTFYEEFKETQEFWNAPIYQNVVSQILNKESQGLLNTDNSNSPSE